MECAISDLQLHDISTQPCLDNTQIGVYENEESVQQSRKNLNMEYTLQNRLTVLTKTKRNCGGTNAKLIICAGVNTALYMRRVGQVEEKIYR